MKTSAKGIALIKHFEGFSAKPYLCPGNVVTIGYGHTRTARKDMKPITEAEADAARTRAHAEVDEAFAFARASAYPAPEDALTAVFA